MDYVVEYYTNPARHRGQRFYVRTTIAHVPRAPTPAMPAVLFHLVRESMWKTSSPVLRDQWKLVTALTAEEKAAWFSSLKLDLPGEGRDEFFEKRSSVSAPSSTTSPSAPICSSKT